jgi:hypothetical protein
MRSGGAAMPFFARAFAIGVCLTVGVGDARAQGEPAHGFFPEKNEHVFVPTTFIPDAFVDTELVIGVGYSNSIETEVPLFAPSGEQIATIDGDLMFMTGNVEFNCALRDWIGFFARFNALARSGSNTASIFASGLSAGSGFGLGWEFLMAETDKSMLSGSVELNRTSITLIDVAAFLDQPDQGLSHTFTPLVGSIDARYAYGFNDLIGVSAFGGGGLGENPKKDYESTGFWRLGAVASINLNQRHDIPLGFALGARTSSYPLTFENADGNVWAGLLSVAYTGRPDFSIIIDTVYERVPLKFEDVDVGKLGFTLGLTYCF